MRFRRVLYVQTYCAKTAQRQAELDHALCANISNKALDGVVLYIEPGSPPPNVVGGVPTEIIELPRRLGYAEWIEHLRIQHNTIGILANADLELGHGIEQMEAVLDTADSAIALTRYNIDKTDGQLKLNPFPQWTQDLWALRSDAYFTESFLSACDYRLGTPGCDNRFAFALWCHGFRIRNPCHWISTLHHHADQSRAYDKLADRLYGPACYVYPSLTLNEDAELQHTLWSRSQDPPHGILVNTVGESIKPLQLRSVAESKSVGFVDQLKDAAMASAYHVFDGKAKQRHLLVPVNVLIEGGISYTASDSMVIYGAQIRLPTKLGGQWSITLTSTDGSTNVRRNTSPGQRLFVDISENSSLPHSVAIALEPAAVKSTCLSQSSPNSVAEVQIYEDAASLHTRYQTLAAQATPVMDGENAESALNIHHPTTNVVSEIDLDEWRLVFRYNNRFSVLATDSQLLFLDRFWPTAVSYELTETLDDPTQDEARDLFLFGFTTPLLEWKPSQFKPAKQYQDDYFFWQFPCRTEQDAYLKHRDLTRPCNDNGACHVYVGMPWATWIDRKSIPLLHLRSTRSRLNAVAQMLSQWGLRLEVHTVCQHIKWKEWFHLFQMTGITQLWLSHKPNDQCNEAGITLCSWPLYAVNLLEPGRGEGLQTVSMEKKKHLASFKGAYMPHYISDIRLHLKELHGKEGFVVLLDEEWHFNPIVYGHQVLGQPMPAGTTVDLEIQSYNKLLANSVFCLCPSGAGPNTLRLWEALGAGVIPVILSDTFEAPSIRDNDGKILRWDDAVLFHCEKDWARLPARLKEISTEERITRQDLCRYLFKASRHKTCFGP